MMFITKEEKERRKQLDNRLELLEGAIKEIYIFPGSKKEYEAFKGYEVEIIDTKRADIGITNFELTSNLDFGEYLVNQGIEAIINARESPTGMHPYYGLPVRKVGNLALKPPINQRPNSL